MYEIVRYMYYVYTFFRQPESISRGSRSIGIFCSLFIFSVFLFFLFFLSATPTSPVNQCLSIIYQFTCIHVYIATHTKFWYVKYWSIQQANTWELKYNVNTYKRCKGICCACSHSAPFWTLGFHAYLLKLKQFTYSPGIIIMHAIIND